MENGALMGHPSGVTIQLTPDEALVLFEFLERFSETDALSINDPAEQRVLWNICTRLEKLLSEPFVADYQAVLERARARLRDAQK